VKDNQIRFSPRTAADFNIGAIAGPAAKGATKPAGEQVEAQGASEIKDGLTLTSTSASNQAIFFAKAATAKTNQAGEAVIENQPENINLAVGGQIAKEEGVASFIADAKIA
jgi:hypothetical protein